MTNSVKTYTLKKPIKPLAGGEMIKELTLKEPSHIVVDKVGFPFLLTAGGQDIRPDRIREYLADMSGVMMPDLKNLSHGDLLELASIVVDFFA